MKTSDFDYELPPELIAQTPLPVRDQSRLMVLDRTKWEISHRKFSDLVNLLEAGDLLVINTTRVIQARLFARKETGGRVEMLLLRKQDGNDWQALVGGKGLGVGKRLKVEAGPECEVSALLDGAQRLIHFQEPIEPFLEKAGHVPLPPYIHAQLEDPQRYQTIFARQLGSAAAPTAGLHFTEELLAQLHQKGIETADVLLHVGLDTFAPVTEQDPAEHIIHREWCQVPQSTCDKVNATRARKGRVIAVGTTSVRSLESAAARSVSDTRQFTLKPLEGNTDLFILPGFQFRVVDAMITNFHLPKSTLIMLVSAFAGKDLILKAYEIAREQRYRFYSFGDAMLIL